MKEQAQKQMASISIDQIYKSLSGVTPFTRPAAANTSDSRSLTVISKLLISIVT